MIFHIDSVYRSFKNIKKSLKDIEDEWKDKKDIKRIVNIFEGLDSAEPLSGCGMFQITRGTLTSMISTSITYLIILVQFKISLIQM